jgi:hypothetical protein
MVTSGGHTAIVYVTNKALELFMFYKFRYRVKLPVFRRFKVYRSLTTTVY